MTTSHFSQVISELHSITDRADQEQSRIGYFSALYTRVTAAIMDRAREGFFTDGARMERFAAAFARLYIDEVEKRWSGRGDECASWRVAFDACDQTDTIVLQHIYLGLNAHLLRDLPIAAVQTCPGDALAGLKQDYMKINEVVLSQMDAFHADLGRVSPRLSWVKQRAGRYWEILSIRTLRTARALAWRSAEALSWNGRGSRVEKVFDWSAALLGRAILKPGPPAVLVVRAIREVEEDDVRQVIRVLKGNSA